MQLASRTSTYRGSLIKGVYKKWIKTGDRVLDVGCGNGYVADLLARELNIKITGCDVKNYLCVIVPFVKLGKNNKLPTVNKKYDAVMYNDVMHHIDAKDQEGVILEGLRVGKKVLLFEMEPTILNKILDYVLNKFHYDSLDTPLSFRTARDWGKLFKKMSLKYKVVKVKRPFWYPFSHIAMVAWR